VTGNRELGESLALLYRALHLSGADRADRVNDPDVVAAVDFLRDRFHGGDSDDHRVRHALGWWHEVLAQASTDPGAAEREHATAVEILLPIYRAAPDKVPESVARTIAASAETNAWLAAQPGIDANEAVRYGRRVLAATPESYPDYPAMLSGLAADLWTRFEHTGHLGDMDHAIELGLAALHGTPEGHPERPGRQSNLGGMFWTRFQNAGRLGDLDQAIELSWEALDGIPGDHPARSAMLSNLGLALRTRFERTGQVADLDEAIDRGRAALDAAPEGHPADPGHLSNLSRTLRTRFEHTGQLADLDEAIDLGWAALDGTPQDDPQRQTYLSILGFALRIRFEHAGYLRDISQAIALHREALDATPEYSPDRPRRLSDLSLALWARFERSGHLPDLDEAITLTRTALELIPDSHPDHPSYLSDLGGELWARFERSGHLPDLNEAIARTRAAIELKPDNHPQRTGMLSNLSLVLRTRFNLTGQSADLDEAIDLANVAAESTPTDHPDHPRCQWNLGLALQARFARHGLQVDSDEARRAFGRAAASPVGAPVVVCAAAAELGRMLNGVEAVAAFERAARLLPRIAPHGLGVEDSIAQLSRLTLARLGRDAAAACLAVGDAGAALMMLESVRAVVFTRTLQTRTDLDRLAEAHPDLAARIDAALGVLNRSAARMTPQDAPDPGAGLAPDQMVVAAREAALSLEELLVQVRRLPEPGWDRFFLPPLLEQVVPAAAGGPVVIVNVADRRCDALIVTEGGVTNLELPSLTEDDAIANTNRFLGAIDILYDRDSTPADLASARVEVWRVCGWLWDTVAGPVLKHLGHNRARTDRDYPGWPRVWWIPTGPLTLLPLHAAGHHAHPDQPGQVRRDRTVIDRVVSSTTPTLSALLQARTRAVSPLGIQRVLVAGLVDTPDVAGTAVARLPAVKAEVAAITAAVSSVPVTVLTDVTIPPARPTKPALVAALPGHAWAHIACHAVTDPDQPTLSQLLLADHEDDPFTVLDLTGLALPNPDLLYLSACTTARTGFTSLDDPVHFAAAAQLAGYRHVIATLWPLYDDAEPAGIIYGDLAHEGHPNTWDAAGAAAAVHHATHHLREASHRPRETPRVPIHAWAPLIHIGP